jgi:hypothetical protein
MAQEAEGSGGGRSICASTTPRVKFVEHSQFADPDVAARKLVGIANGAAQIAAR